MNYYVLAYITYDVLLFCVALAGMMEYMVWRDKRGKSAAVTTNTCTFKNGSKLSMSPLDDDDGYGYEGAK